MGSLARKLCKGCNNNCKKHRGNSPKRKQKNDCHASWATCHSYLERNLDQKRKYDIQREDSPVCLVCQGTEGEADDTILHRKFGCQGIQKMEGYKKFEWIRDCVQGYHVGYCSDRWQLWINTGLRHTPGVLNLDWIQDISQIC